MVIIAVVIVLSVMLALSVAYKLLATGAIAYVAYAAVAFCVLLAVLVVLERKGAFDDCRIADGSAKRSAAPQVARMLMLFGMAFLAVTGVGALLLRIFVLPQVNALIWGFLFPID